MQSALQASSSSAHVCGRYRLQQRSAERSTVRAGAANGQSYAGNTTVHQLIKENGIVLLPGARAAACRRRRRSAAAAGGACAQN